MLTKTILRDQKTNVSHTHSILTCAQTISRRYLVRIVWHLCELETKNYITHCALAAIQLRNIMHNILCESHYPLSKRNAIIAAAIKRTPERAQKQTRMIPPRVMHDLHLGF
jgi:hypothetical protein